MRTISYLDMWWSLSFCVLCVIQWNIYVYIYIGIIIIIIIIII